MVAIIDGRPLVMFTYAKQNSACFRARGRAVVMKPTILSVTISVVSCEYYDFIVSARLRFLLESYVHAACV